MNIGILYCGYNQLDNIQQTLDFWNNLKIPGYNFIVGVVSVPFEEYKDIEHHVDNSIDYINKTVKNNLREIITEPKFIKEKTARTICFERLSKYGIDLLWQVDSDEFYTLDNIKSILSFIEKDNSIVFSINFKNYIFDGKHYLDDFCPPKINKLTGLNILGFVDDNQVFYKNYGVLPSKPIPKDIAFVKHLTWMNKDGKKKVEYQLKHFGDCSYKWNSEKCELEIDLSYYVRHGYKVPNVIKEI